MTIGKKLYYGFGAILAIMLALFVINVITVRREYSAQDTANAKTNHGLRFSKA